MSRSISPAGLVILLLLICSISFADLGHPAEQEPQAKAAAQSNPAPAIFIGFIGGLLHHKAPRYMELAETLRADYGDKIRVEIVYNGHGDKKKAKHSVLQWLDTDGDAAVSDEEKRQARIVLLGHSFGAAAAVSFARDLQNEQIPVLLTVQIDSIAKPGQNDRVIPSNVSQAINFYQNRGLLQGRSRIVAADPAHTQILGNLFVPYDPKVSGCKDYSLFYKILSKNHITIDCDSRIWSQIEPLIDKNVSQATSQELKIREELQQETRTAAEPEVRPEQ